MDALSLYELNQRVRWSLAENFLEEVWIRAELSDVRVNANGHCYLEFVEKEPHGNRLIAQARGIIWSNIFRLLKPYFEQETGQLFASGIKVLVQVSVEFHELYGYSLTVKDIDPSYTVGDLARRRREILRQLEDEGVLTLNKELYMPLLAQRIAVISSATAAGYGDFCNQLLNNPYGLVFYPKLFPAVMQGERVEESVLAALDNIYAQEGQWDAVVIIRGGGATADLSGFDTYLLAASCAQFPLPIITGIGHERDDTVIDSVAHTRVKTPTAAAEYLITHVLETASRLEALHESVVSATTTFLQTERHRMERLSGRLPLLLTMRKQHEEHLLVSLEQRMEQASFTGLGKAAYRLELLERQLRQSCLNRLVKENHRLQLMDKVMEHASPERLLKRGYSITLYNGKAVTDETQLQAGDELETILAKGKVKSVVSLTTD